RSDKWTGARGDRTYRHENCARKSAREPAPESTPMQWPLARDLHRNLFPNRGSAPMKSIRWQKLTVRNAACLAFTVAGSFLATGCASDPRPVVVGQVMALPALNDYCALAQKEVASSRVPARNVLVSDYQSFSRAS